MIDPQGTSIWSGTVETDRFGGGSVEAAIPKDMKLGLIIFKFKTETIPTNLMIRIEEYRKPEFEVIIDAPKDADPTR